MTRSLSDYYADAWQIAYVCEDVEDSAAYFEKTFGTSTQFTFIAGLPMQNCFLDGAPVEGVLDVAVAMVGERQIELIAPVSGDVGMFGEHVRPGSAGTFHHFGVKLDRLDDATSLVGEMGRSWKLVGHIPNVVRFAYLDTRVELGHFVEFIEYDPTFVLPVG